MFNHFVHILHASSNTFSSSLKSPHWCCDLSPFENVEFHDTRTQDILDGLMRQTNKKSSCVLLSNISHMCLSDTDYVHLFGLCQNILAKCLKSFHEQYIWCCCWSKYTQRSCHILIFVASKALHYITHYIQVLLFQYCLKSLFDVLRRASIFFRFQPQLSFHLFCNCLMSFEALVNPPLGALTT